MQPTGEAHEIAASIAAQAVPPPGIELVDRLMDAQDQRDLHDRIVEEAQRKAAQRLAEGPK
jgi:hypothetical protein